MVAQNRSSHQICSIKKCSEEFFTIYKKTPVLESLLNIKKRIQHSCFPVNIVKFLRTCILKNIWEQLLLSEPAMKILLKA